jgi:hypothetical protein
MKLPQLSLRELFWPVLGEAAAPWAGSLSLALWLVPVAIGLAVAAVMVMFVIVGESKQTQMRGAIVALVLLVTSVLLIPVALCGTCFVRP